MKPEEKVSNQINALSGIAAQDIGEFKIQIGAHGVSIGNQLAKRQSVIYSDEGD